MGDMRTSYWAMYASIKFKEQYYWHYSIGSKRINGCISGGLLAVSLGGVGTWAIWNYYQFSWIGAGIAALAQVVQVLNQYYFPFAKQDAALRYLRPQLSKLVLAIESDLIQIRNNAFDDKKIARLISEYKAQYVALDIQYTDALYFPRRKRSEKAAQIDWERYFNQNYDTRR